MHDRVVLIRILPLQSSLSVQKGRGPVDVPPALSQGKCAWWAIPAAHTVLTHSREELSHAPREKFGRNILSRLFPPERENEESFYFLI